jgi:DNA-binding transcriptional regulator YiaG
MSPIAIVRLRKRLKLTQKQLADKIGATQVTIARYETGVSKPTGAYLLLLKQLSEQAMKRRVRR